MRAIGLASTSAALYALRDDGAVFVLLPRGSIDLVTGNPRAEPVWVLCPAIPGTEAAVEAIGEAPHP